MDSKAKSKPFPRRAVITAALESSLLPPLIGLICDFVPFGPLHMRAASVTVTGRLATP
jgi:hypothetical protein